MVNSIKTPKVLMISPYFVPRKRVGALRSFKFAKHLKELDWQVCVVHLEAKGQTCYCGESRLGRSGAFYAKDAF